MIAPLFDVDAGQRFCEIFLISIVTVLLLTIVIFFLWQFAQQNTSLLLLQEIVYKVVSL